MTDFERTAAIRTLAPPHTAELGSVIRTAASPDRRARHRYLSIDILRALAILLMIEDHFVENLSSKLHSPQGLYDILVYIGMIPAPLFAVLSGLSFSLWLRAQRDAGRSERDITKYSLRRGMFMFVLGFAVNIFIWLPKSIFNWDILTLLGAAAMVITAIRNWYPTVLIGICALILLASPPLRDMANYYRFWITGEYTYQFAFSDVALGFLLNGYFPMLPWLIYPVVGFVIGQLYCNVDDNDAPSLSFAVPLVGSLLIAIAAIGMLIEPYAPKWAAKYYFNEMPSDLYPAVTVFVLGSIGATMLTVWFLSYTIDDNRRITGTGPVLAFLKLYGEFALTAYLVHLAVHVWPLWMAATWQHQSSIEYYEGRLTQTPTALGLAVLFAVLFYPCLVVFQRHRKYSVEHLMRRVCA
jgi:uncharacterized membrane protein